jgi:hypothetical protein
MKIYEILRENVDQSLPPTIKPLKVPAFPQMPQQDGDLGDGQQAGSTRDGGKYLSGSEGKFIWDKQGQPSKWQAPSFGGMTQTVNMKTGDITARLQQGGLDVSAVYDKTGKLKPGQSSAGYDMGVAKVRSGPQGNTMTVRGGARDGSQDQTKEEAPPGRERQVKALKKEFPDDEGAPYAIAWAQHNKKNKNKTTETRGTTLPQKIDVVKMPQPPQAPTADTPDGTDENGTRINTTPKGNRSVKNGGGTYIFTPQGKLMLYMSPKIGGLQQTHNLIKKTVTANFGTAVDQGDGDVNIDQKATYDMQGNLISDDNLSMNRGDLTVGLNKDDGASMNYRVNNNTTVSANTRRGISVNRNDPEVNEEAGLDPQTQKARDWFDSTMGRVETIAPDAGFEFDPNTITLKPKAQQGGVRMAKNPEVEKAVKQAVAKLQATAKKYGFKAAQGTPASQPAVADNPDNW